MSNIFILMAPEGALFLIILFLFVASALGHKASTSKMLLVHRWLPVAAAVLLAITLSTLSLPQTSLFSGSYEIDLVSQFFKMAVAAGFLFVTLNEINSVSLDREVENDYFLFMAFSAWGLMLLASAAELVVLFLALELSSYSLCILIPLRATSRRSAEAGAKYLLYGAAATALSLYGLSHIIATQHTTYITELATMDWSFASNPEAVLGLALFLCGIFYKLALFPFHFWCPDVYQGARNETAAYVATLPKLGGIVILIRLSLFLTPGLEITNALAAMAFISMTYGNLCALAQKDLKRLLGFSSVAHAGYIMVGIIVGTAQGIAAASFYALAYIIMNLLCFWVISRIATDGRNLTLNDLNGLYRRSPILAFSLAVGAFSLVGLPPTIGFAGKLFLIFSAWDHGYNWLVIALVVNSAIAIWYYLNLVRHAYTEERAPTETQDSSILANVGALTLSALALLLGVLPTYVFDLALKAASALR